MGLDHRSENRPPLGIPTYPHPQSTWLPQMTRQGLRASCHLSCWEHARLTNTPLYLSSTHRHPTSVRFCGQGGDIRELAAAGSPSGDSTLDRAPGRSRSHCRPLPVGSGSLASGGIQRLWPRYLPDPPGHLHPRAGYPSRGCGQPTLGRSSSTSPSERWT